MKNSRSIRSLLSLDSPRFRHGAALYYVAPFVNWVLDWEAHYITRQVREQFGLDAHVVKSTRGLSRQIIHYGSIWDLLAFGDSMRAGDNFLVGTVLYGHKDRPESQDAIGKVLQRAGSLAKLHVSNRIMEQRFLEWGVERGKLVRIPLGVDLTRFQPATPAERMARRRELGIPEDAFCIGSFHKDGQGMGDGNLPKLIKGPDVLLETLQRVHQRRKIFVLLSAPARGYVKRGLDAAGIPYRHVVEEDFHRIPRLFHAIDLYLLASREEGGPKGVLEALASGVPFVGTRVGLVPDVVTHGASGLLADSEDAQGLAEGVERLMESPELRAELVRSGLEAIRVYDWPLIARRYYRELYEPFLPVAK